MENQVIFAPVQEAMLREIVEFWNQNFSSAFQVKESMIRSKNLTDRDIFTPGTFLCMDEKKLVGLIVTKISDNSLPEHQNAAWLSVLAVEHTYRRRGLGGKMYRKAEEELNPWRFPAVLKSPGGTPCADRLDRDQGFLRSVRA